MKSTPNTSFSVNKKTVAQVNQNRKNINDRRPASSSMFQLKWGVDKETQTQDEDCKKNIATSEKSIKDNN